MFKLTNEPVWVKVVLGSLILFTLYINIFAALKYGDYFLLGSKEKMNNDDVRYIRTGLVLLEKGMLVDNDVNKPTVAEMPGHAMMLAALFKLFGYPEGLTAFRILQACLQGICIFLVFLICKSTFGSKVGLLACTFSAIYLPDVVSTGLALMEVTYKFLLLLLIYISILAIRTRKTQYYVSGGVIWALACLIRPTLGLFPAVILGVWILYRYPIKSMIKYTLITSAVFVVLMSPWWVRNYLTFNQFIPFSLASGNPFLQGTYINYDQTRDFIGYSPGRDAMETDRIEMEVGIKRLKTYFKKYPLEYIHWYTIGKTKYMWYFPYYWKTVFDIHYNTVARFHLFILATGVFGSIAAIWGKHRRDSAILILTILYFTVTHLPYFTFARYAYPAMPLVIILTAYGIKSVVKYIIKGPQGQGLTAV